MNRVETTEAVKMVAAEIPGYDYGAETVARSPVSMQDLEWLKQTAGFGTEDEQWLRAAGEVLAGQTQQLVGIWRNRIGELPYLARYSQGPDGQKNPRYSERSGLRLEQWVLDTCLRSYDQDWLNYQHEMALRHTSVKKNRTDGVQSAPTIHLRYIIAFGAVLTDPNIMKPFLEAKGHEAAAVERMLQAWSRSIWLQIALWTEAYTDRRLASDEW